MGMRQLEWKGALMKSQLYYCGPQYKDYDVWLEAGNWPPNYDMVTLMDGGDPTRPWDDQMHDGGEVLDGSEGMNHRVVRVFNGGSGVESEGDGDYA